MIDEKLINIHNKVYLFLILNLMLFSTLLILNLIHLVKKLQILQLIEINLKNQNKICQIY